MTVSGQDKLATTALVTALIYDEWARALLLENFTKNDSTKKSASANWPRYIFFSIDLSR
jgi:hypothetical protein